MELLTVARVMPSLAVLSLALAMAALAQVAAATGSPSAKAIPAGCWIGKTAYSGTYHAGSVNAKVSSGKLTFVVWVESGKSATAAVGFMTVTGNGAGTLKVAGSTLSLKVKILGDYDLTGTASALKANGLYSMTGTAKGSGQFLPSIPVKLKWPVKNAAVTVTSVSGSHVGGLFGKAPWTATRHPGAPSKNPAACANAA